VKHQYVGDLNDYRKYALFRALSASGLIRVGVCWMLTGSDGSTDGSNLAYLSQPERHRNFDPELFDVLVSASAAPDWRRLETIEASGAIPNAIYQNALLPDDVAGRSVFMQRCQSEFTHADLIFFDPDNGLEVSVAMGRKNSSKYLYLNEVTEFYSCGKSLLIYQHFPRIERKAFTTKCIAKLQLAAPDADIWTFTTAHVVFFLLIHPLSAPDLTIAASQASMQWSHDFIVVLQGGNEPPIHN
jgi:hypothetical protein